ncbi:MAG: DUF2089 family protein [Eubacteriales bacterium]
MSHFNYIKLYFNFINIFIDIALNIIYNWQCKGEIFMAYENSWLAELDTEDINFIKKFILASGSLKEIAKIYDVSYPTVRLRLDKLIQKIQLNEKSDEDEFISLIKRLAIDEKVELDTAKVIIGAYKKGKEENTL